eukprot:gene3428-3902_t
MPRPFRTCMWALAMAAAAPSGGAFGYPSCWLDPEENGTRDLTGASAFTLSAPMKETDGNLSNVWPRPAPNNRRDTLVPPLWAHAAYGLAQRTPCRCVPLPVPAPSWAGPSSAMPVPLVSYPSLIPDYCLKAVWWYGCRRESPCPRTWASLPRPRALVSPLSLPRPHSCTQAQRGVHPALSPAAVPSRRPSIQQSPTTVSGYVCPGQDEVFAALYNASQKPPQPEPFADGAMVQIKGLQSAWGSKLNGQAGKVIDWDAGAGRHQIQLNNPELSP